MGVEIRDWVREQRDREGWSNVQISRILGCDQSAASRILSGDRGLSAAELLILFDAVGLPSPLVSISPETVAVMKVLEAMEPGDRGDAAAIVHAAAQMTPRDRKKLRTYLSD